jgi:hypothetical protein
MLDHRRFLRFIAQARNSSGRAPEVGVLKGDPSRPRSVSTYVMGGGMLLLLIGFLSAGPLILLPGGVLFVIGLLLAVIEAIFEK